MEIVSCANPRPPAPANTKERLAKPLSFLAIADSAGLVLGARVPVVLTSRADSVRARLASAAVALRLAHARRASGGAPA